MNEWKWVDGLIIIADLFLNACFMGTMLGILCVTFNPEYHHAKLILLS